MYKGGGAIASGSYGCVFSPAFYCTNVQGAYNKHNYVSKLMLNSEASKEYQELLDIKNIIKKNKKRHLFARFLPLMKTHKCSYNIEQTSELDNFEKCENVKGIKSHNLSNIKKQLLENK